VDVSGREGPCPPFGTHDRLKPGYNATVPITLPLRQGYCSFLARQRYCSHCTSEFCYFTPYPKKAYFSQPSSFSVACHALRASGMRIDPGMASEFLTRI
jgi:hypothetical protein